MVTLANTTETITSFAALRRCAQPLGPQRLAVVVADDEVALTAADFALRLGIAQPVLIGNAPTIRGKAASLGLAELVERAEFVDTENAAKIAVEMARAGKVDILLKGHLRPMNF